MNARHLRRPIALVCLPALFALTACQSGETPPGASVPVSAPGTAMAEVDTIAVEDAVAALEGLEGAFDCAAPNPRADDYAYVCEGSSNALTSTIQLFAREVDGPVFGASLVVQATDDGESEQVVEETERLALDLVGAAVPEPWREPAARLISEHLPDGGRTLDVPGAGITASVQPLARLQWYVELYELDGQEG